MIPSFIEKQRKRDVVFYFAITDKTLSLTPGLSMLQKKHFPRSQRGESSDKKSLWDEPNI